ncbi:MAG TPA: TetR/AcrR family transcriptional regulator [Solirubrobacteraceae bacterium]|nr:TetR/AcrR family transcriptional regulator [Solirubrobacteraceae bacterium]
MTELSARHSYPAVSVADVASHAGVSSATFYEQFTDKEDCLVAAYRLVADRLLAGIPDGDSEADWREKLRRVLAQLLKSFEEEPDAGRLLLVEALAGGPRVRAERARAVGDLRSRVQRILDSAKRDGLQVDIPAPLIVGAVRSIASSLLRSHNDDRLSRQVDGLMAWACAYAVPVGEKRWSSGTNSTVPVPLAREWTRSVAAFIQPPERLPRGRHKLPAAAVVRTQRARIAYGTAKVIVEKGYAAATVTDIVAAAGISRDVFYAQFSNKLEAYMAAQQFGTDELLTACAAAYFAPRAWPERVWYALQMLLTAMAANPELSHLRIVECYAAGPAAIEQTESLKRAAAIFLQEGYVQRESAASLPRLCSQAIIGAVFELLYDRLANGQALDIPRQLPMLAHVAMTPFVGAQKASEALGALRETAVERAS